MPETRDRGARAQTDVEARRATAAGWSRAFGPSPFEHAEFVEGIEASLSTRERTDSAEAQRFSPGVAAQLAALEGAVGFVEGPNNENPYGPWQGVSNAAWCDSFAQWAAVAHGGFEWPEGQFGVKGDAYCPYTKAHARKFGYWRDGQETPQPGWQVLFSWSQNGIPDHIGTVVGVNEDGTLVTVEGNYQDSVARVTRTRDYVDGYVELPFGSGQSRPLGRPTLRIGYCEPTVKELQQRLVDLGYDVGPSGVDGEFGPATENAVRSFQRDHIGQDGAPLEVDGVVGPATWGALDAA